MVHNATQYAAQWELHEQLPESGQPMSAQSTEVELWPKGPGASRTHASHNKLNQQPIEVPKISF